jgi:hypothetical protein
MATSEILETRKNQVGAWVKLDSFLQVFENCVRYGLGCAFAECIHTDNESSVVEHERLLIGELGVPL